MFPKDHTMRRDAMTGDAGRSEAFNRGSQRRCNSGETSYTSFKNYVRIPNFEGLKDERTTPIVRQSLSPDRNSHGAARFRRTRTPLSSDICRARVDVPGGMTVRQTFAASPLIEQLQRPLARF